MMKGFAKLIRRCWLILVHLAFFLFAIAMFFAVFGMPGSFVNWMVAGDVALDGPARTVVVLGGGGIPSETGLIRAYYAAWYGMNVTNATNVTFVVCLPSDIDPEIDSVGRMRDELVLRGIRRESILMEHYGRDTHQQAVNVRKLLGEEACRGRLLIVSSPYHARRALMCFREAGFKKAACLAACNVEPEADMGPAVGTRYGFWSGLVWEVWYARELVALAYYKLRGWI
jgi:uncharacterized SAM-binding protein YcdF (DUF218 family)